jgi:hypothetical protein
MICQASAHTRQEFIVTMSTTRMTVSASVLLAVVGAALAGCASGKSASTPAGPQASATAQATTVAGLPTSTAGLGDSSSTDAKVCAAIQGDVAAITKNVSDPKTFPGQCAFGDGATTVTFNVSDPQHSGVTDVISGNGTSISGIGDGAVWYDAGGTIVPSLGAWKGSVSCLVQPDSDITNDDVTYTGNPPFTKISTADGAAYAQKLGKVCADVFSAAG